jgi:hypothetical protein
MSHEHLFTIGTPVHHTGHGNGVIVGHNGVPPLQTDALAHFADLNIANLQPALAGTLTAGMMAGLYSGDQFPYIIEFEDGYKDVYSPSDITKGHMQVA